MHRHEPEEHTAPVVDGMSTNRRMLKSTRNFLVENRNKFAAGAVATILTVTLAACGPDAKVEVPAPSAKTSTPATPGAKSPEPVKEAIPAETAPTSEISAEDLAKMQGYEALTDVQFNNLPKFEQRQYWHWKSQGIRAFADGWYNYTKKPEDKYPDVISKDNTAQEVTTIMGYQLRYILSRAADERSKLLIAVLEQGSQSPVYSLWMDRFAKDTATTDMENPLPFAVSGALPISTGVSFVGESSVENGDIKKLVLDPSNNLKTAFYFDNAAPDPNTGNAAPEWYRY